MSEFTDELRSRINPAYAHQMGTESYERRVCAEHIERLELEAVAATIRIENAAAEIERLSSGWAAASADALVKGLERTEDLQYIAGIVEEGRGTKTPDDMKVRAAILGYVQELEMKIEQINACWEEERNISDELARERDAYQQAADSMAAAHKVERDGLAQEATRARNDERIAMSYLSDARKALGVDCDFPSMIALIAALKLDAARLDWLLPVVTGVSNEMADNRTLGLARQLVNGLDNRQAIDAAMREVK